ncbi:20522_t:CDS:2, partial [Gigaspora rosea]
PIANLANTMIENYVRTATANTKAQTNDTVSISYSTDEATTPMTASTKGMSPTSDDT